MSDTMNSEAARDRRHRFGAQRGRDLYWGFSCLRGTQESSLAINPTVGRCSVWVCLYLYTRRDTHEDLLRILLEFNWPKVKVRKML